MVLTHLLDKVLKSSVGAKSDSLVTSIWRKLTDVPIVTYMLLLEYRVVAATDAALNFVPRDCPI